MQVIKNVNKGLTKKQQAIKEIADKMRAEREALKEKQKNLKDENNVR